MKILDRIKDIIYYIVIFIFYVLFSIVNLVTSKGEDRKWKLIGNLYGLHYQ